MLTGARNGWQGSVGLLDVTLVRTVAPIFSSATAMGSGAALGPALTALPNSSLLAIHPIGADLIRTKSQSGVARSAITQ
jgi:hypothetical protein